MHNRAIVGFPNLPLLLIKKILGANQPTCVNLETTDQNHYADPMDRVRGLKRKKRSAGGGLKRKKIPPLTLSIGSASSGPDW